MFFPDLPACVAHDATAQEAALAAAEVLASFVSLADEHGGKLAGPSELDAIQVDSDVQEVARILVPVEMKGRSVRVQITLDEGRLAAIDKAAANRSGLIAEAARRAAAAGGIGSRKGKPAEETCRWSRRDNGGMEMSHQQLAAGIVGLSVADNWAQAKLEWELETVSEADSHDPGTCLCGHFPIIELCELRNTLNRNTTVVGNCCVKKFLGLPSHLIFDGLKRVRQDLSKALNGESIEYARRKRWITDWETKFLFDTARKRVLSSKQADVRQRINAKVMAAFTHERLNGRPR